MDYELAKQLKDADFPYKTVFEDGELRKYPPTLEELIEACGTWFQSLTYNKSQDNWTARYASMVIKESTGKTPTEAVARLWLKLNKK